MNRCKIGLTLAFLAFGCSGTAEPEGPQAQGDSFTYDVTFSNDYTNDDAEEQDLGQADVQVDESVLPDVREETVEH
ncbi:MAG: hypothetical protein KC561_17405 [Myxococcales bacterium]|nr:hypothetical protein [Myxococcales bacterium]